VTNPARLSDDPMDGAPIGCTIQLTSEGALTLRRGQGCTPADARDLCSQIVRGDVQVIDLTPSPRMAAQSPITESEVDSPQ